MIDLVLDDRSRGGSESDRRMIASGQVDEVGGTIRRPADGFAWSDMENSKARRAECERVGGYGRIELINHMTRMRDSVGSAPWGNQYDRLDVELERVFYDLPAMRMWTDREKFVNCWLSACVSWVCSFEGAATFGECAYHLSGGTRECRCVDLLETDTWTWISSVRRERDASSRELGIDLMSERARAWHRGAARAREDGASSECSGASEREDAYLGSDSGRMTGVAGEQSDNSDEEDAGGLGDGAGGAGHLNHDDDGAGSGGGDEGSEPSEGPDQIEEEGVSVEYSCGFEWVMRVICTASREGG